MFPVDKLGKHSIKYIYLNHNNDAQQKTLIVFHIEGKKQQ